MSSQMTRDTRHHNGARWFINFYVRVQSSGGNDTIKVTIIHRNDVIFKNNVITSVCCMLCCYLKTSSVALSKTNLLID